MYILKIANISDLLPNYLNSPVDPSPALQP